MITSKNVDSRFTPLFVASLNASIVFLKCGESIFLLRAFQFLKKQFLFAITDFILETAVPHLWKVDFISEIPKAAAAPCCYLPCSTPVLPHLHAPAETSASQRNYDGANEISLAGRLCKSTKTAHTRFNCTPRAHLFC